jgi:O-antigen/teichoic acid export membrane protein
VVSDATGGTVVEARRADFPRDVLLATLTSLATGIALMMVTSLLARGLGTVEFGVYSLARRFVATAAPVASLAMGIAVARYAAVAEGPRGRLEVLVGGLLLGVLPSAAALAIAAWRPDFLNAAIFRGTGSNAVSRSMLLLLVATNLFTILFAFYRGTGQMSRANLWQLAAIGVVPVVVAALATAGGAATVLTWMALPLLASAAPLAVYLARGAPLIRSGFEPRGAVRQLASYGLPRVPGGFALAALLGAGPFLAAHYATVEDAGFLTAGQAIFALADAAVAGFGIVVLPRVARLLTEGRTETLREGVTDAVEFSVHAGFFAALQLLIWSREIVGAWLGAEFARAVPLMRILLVALSPYVVYTLLRSVVDAVQVQAVNTRNLVLALAVTLAVSLVLGSFRMGAIGLAIGTSIGMGVLGAGTLVSLRHAGLLDMRRLRIVPALGLAAALSAVAFATHALLVNRWASAMTVATGGVLEAALAALYYLGLRRFRTGWVMRLESRVAR